MCDVNLPLTACQRCVSRDSTIRASLAEEHAQHSKHRHQVHLSPSDLASRLPTNYTMVTSDPASARGHQPPEAGQSTPQLRHGDELDDNFSGLQVHPRAFLEKFMSLICYMRLLLQRCKLIVSIDFSASDSAEVRDTGRDTVDLRIQKLVRSRSLDSGACFRSAVLGQHSLISRTFEYDRCNVMQSPQLCSACFITFCRRHECMQVCICRMIRPQAELGVRA